MYLAQISRCDILYAVNQLARRMSKPSKARMRAVKHLLCYLAGSTDFSITHKQGGFKLAAFSDANWGNNRENSKVNVIVHRDARQRPNRFQGWSSEPHRAVNNDLELVAAALTMKEAVFSKNMMEKLRFKDGFGNAPLYIATRRRFMWRAIPPTPLGRSASRGDTFLRPRAGRGRRDHRSLRQDPRPTRRQWD